MGEFETLRRQIESADTQQESTDIERCFSKVFSTLEGERALQYMCELWLDVQLFVPGDPHYTAYKLGHADLINFIKECVKAEKG